MVPVARLKSNSITLAISVAGRKPVRDKIPLHYPVCDQLASRSATSSRAGSRAASELDEDMRVHFVCVSQAKFHYAGELASRSQTSSRPNSITLSSLRAGLRPARELVADLLLVVDLLASKIA